MNCGNRFIVGEKNVHMLMYKSRARAFRNFINRYLGICVELIGP